MKQLKPFQLLFLFTVISNFIFAQEKKLNWTAQQCIKLKNITAVRPSPDGTKVLYTVREAIMTADRSEYINQVFVCNADGSNTIQLTRGESMLKKSIPNLLTSTNLSLGVLSILETFNHQVTHIVMEAGPYQTASRTLTFFKVMLKPNIWLVDVQCM